MESLSTGRPRRLSSKEYTCQCRRGRRLSFDPSVGKIPWRRKWQPAPIFLSGKFHEQRSLVGYSPWGHKESDMIESRTTHCQWTDPLALSTVFPKGCGYPCSCPRPARVGSSDTYVSDSVNSETPCNNHQAPCKWCAVPRTVATQDTNKF